MGDRHFSHSQPVLYVQRLPSRLYESARSFTLRAGPQIAVFPPSAGPQRPCVHTEMIRFASRYYSCVAILTGIVIHENTCFDD
jgi:hypothetical protein